MGSQRVRKILIINIFGIGDVLFTTPLIKNIKLQIPDAFIGYVANARTAAILEEHAEVDKVYVYERDEFHAVYQKSRMGFLKKVFSALGPIKTVGYDLVIDLSLNGYASFLMWLIGIRKRLGFNYKNRSRFLNKPVKLEGYEGRHVVEFYLSLFEKLGFTASAKSLSIPVSDAQTQWANDYFNQHGLAFADCVVAIVPGGGASWGKDAVYKRWPVEKYAQLADKIIEKCGVTVILLGDETDRNLCRRISGMMQHPIVEASGTTSIGQCAALMGKCSLAIVNDGGPLHIAVAAGTRTVSIFGPVDEKVYGPYPRTGHAVVTKDVPCRPCYRRFRRAQCDHISCLMRLEVDEVFAAVQQSLNPGKVESNP